MLVLFVYGSPYGAAESNVFYRDVINRVHTSYNGTPILQFGDHNACADVRRDLARTNEPRRNPVAKVALHELCLEHILTDLRRSHHPEAETYTFHKETKNNGRYDANLDFFLANTAWMSCYGDKIVDVHTKDVGSEGLDN